ncbi:unnamed protein product [Lymnaea stagnalis]|uniref:G-protein coupled receptors family 1 profile domain-containing protein n=1 Tax=Lymnaea stagnalis TaxID=6523 RepID=A0AAV2ILK5_LYMST
MASSPLLDFVSIDDDRNTTYLPKEENKTHEEFDAIVSEYQRRLAEIIIDLTMSFILSLSGIFTNLIVMAVFTKQGFKDSVAVSMTAIAFWDLIKCVGGTAQRMSGPISLVSPALAQSWTNMGVVLFDYLLSITAYVTSALAAYVAVERCLCVCIPFKVKEILSPRRTFIASVFISVLVFGSFAVMYGIYDIEWRYDAKYNASVAIYEYNSFSQNNTSLFEYYNIAGFFLPIFFLVVIVISTVIISYKLQKASHFRHATTNVSVTSVTSDVNINMTTTSRTITRRDRKIVKMLLVIIAIYILNLSPRATLYLTKYFIYDFYFLRKYHNFFLTMTYIVFFFDLLNGACNLFVFLGMSTTFRGTCMVMFHFRTQLTRHGPRHSSEY